MHITPAIASETSRTAPAQQALLPWLDMLRQLYPPSALLVVGAGSGRSPWVQYLMAANYDNVTLVEAEATTAARLKLVAQAQPSWKVHGLLVSRSSEPTRFYTASLQPESGLLEPESLLSLWPNLKTIHKQTCQAIALAELQQDTELSANWLMVDCLPALPIIQGATQQLAAFDVIALRVLLGNTQDTANGNGESKSNTNNDELAQSASSHALHTTLQALGFRCLAIETSRNPAIGHALFVRDTVALAQKLQQQLAQQTQILAQTQAQAKAQAETATASAAKQAEERAAQVQQLTQAKAAADKLATERQQQIEQLKEAASQAKSAADKLVNEQLQQLEKLKDQLRQAASSSEHATQQVSATGKQQDQLIPLLAASSGLPNQWNAFAEALSTRLAATETALAKITKQLAPEQLRGLLLPPLNEKLLEQGVIQKDQLKEVETRFRTELGKGLGNAVKQIEAFVSIQNYLTTGESISDFHGWPISPDIGLFLIEKIRERQYDLIIEFGSGTSTLMFAKALSINEQTSNSKAAKRTDNAQKKILSLEHDTIYLEKTRQLLTSQKLIDAVNLYHAPLTDCTEGNAAYLYYNCENILKKVADELTPGIKKILVLVDGPPSATCTNARYLAAPYIFNHFANHQIDFVLDDANRPEEKSVIELWRAFWKKRSIHIQEKLIASEKGIYLASNHN